MVRKILDNGVEWLCLVLMAVLALDLMLGVFSRYVLFSTFTWYDEIARACFVWVVFLGAAVGVLQPKLTVSEPNDQYEREADRVADRVMTMPKSSGREDGCGGCKKDEEQKPLQRQAAEEEEQAPS